MNALIAATAMICWQALAIPAFAGQDKDQDSVQISQDPTVVRDRLIAKIDAGQADDADYLRLQEVCNQIPDIDHGVAYGRKALARLPKSAAAHWRLAVSLRHKLNRNQMEWLNGKGEYLKLLEEAITLDPQYLPAYWELIGFHANAPSFIGASKAKAHQYADAMTGFNRVAGMRAKASVYLQEDKLDAVEAIYRELAQTADGPEPRYEYAMFLLDRQRYREAAAQLKVNAAEPEPHAPSVYQAARAHVLGQFEAAQAIELLDRYLELADGDARPSAADAWNRKGDAFALLGDAERAAACYRRALSLEPDHASAASALAKLDQRP